MEKFKLVISGDKIRWDDEYGNSYEGFDPDSVGIFVTGEGFDDEGIDMDNVYFENIGFIDFESDGEFDEPVRDSDYSVMTNYYSEIEFTEEEVEESENYFDEDYEPEEDESELLRYIEACIGVHYGEVRLNGVPTGINVVKEYYFNDRTLEIEE